MRAEFSTSGERIMWLRADDQSLRRREVALPRSETPKLRCSGFQRSRDDEEIVAAMPAGEGVLRGQFLRAIEE